MTAAMPAPMSASVQCCPRMAAKASEVAAATPPPTPPAAISEPRLSLRAARGIAACPASRSETVVPSASAPSTAAPPPPAMKPSVSAVKRFTSDAVLPPSSTAESSTASMAGAARGSSREQPQASRSVSPTISSSMSIRREEKTVSRSKTQSCTKNRRYTRRRKPAMPRPYSPRSSTPLTMPSAVRMRSCDSVTVSPFLTISAPRATRTAATALAACSRARLLAASSST